MPERFTELIGVPWEYLFDHPGFLAVSEWTPIVRYLDLPRSYRPLGASAAPRTRSHQQPPRLRATRRRTRTRQARARAAPLSDLVELHWLERPTLRALLDELHTQTFHALHYIGHGTYDSGNGQGILLFQSEDGWQDPVKGGKLANVLRDFASLRLTVLNACDGARSSRTDPFAGVAGNSWRVTFRQSSRCSSKSAMRRQSRSVEASINGLRLASPWTRACLAPVSRCSPSAVTTSNGVLRFVHASARRPTIRPRECVPDRSLVACTCQDDARRKLKRRISQRVQRRTECVHQLPQDDASGHARLLAERLQRHFGEANVHLGREPNFDPPGEADVLAKATFLR